MTQPHTPFRFIREHVFGIASQHEFAAALGYEQATVSRFENGVRRISVECQERIRALARARGIEWDNNWFFDVPRVNRPSPKGRKVA